MGKKAMVYPELEHLKLEGLFSFYERRGERSLSDCVVAEATVALYDKGGEVEYRAVVSWVLTTLESEKVIPLVHKKLVKFVWRNRHTFTKDERHRFKAFARKHKRTKKVIRKFKKK